MAVTNFSIEKAVGKTQPSSKGFVQNAPAMFPELETVGILLQKDESNPSTTLDDAIPVTVEDDMAELG